MIKKHFIHLRVCDLAIIPHIRFCQTNIYSFFKVKVAELLIYSCNRTAKCSDVNSSFHMSNQCQITYILWLVPVPPMLADSLGPTCKYQ